MQPFELMADPLHNKRYPEGRKREVTEEWLARVDGVLAENKRAGRAPASRAELMAAIDVDKSSMSQLWGTAKKKRSQTSKLVDPICELLGIDASSPGPAPSVALGPRDENIRRNLVRFRDEAKLSIEQVIGMTGLPIAGYEAGLELVPGTALLELAKVYGHAPGDFELVSPPKGKPEEAPGIFLRTRPGVELDVDEYNAIQAIIDKANARLREKKKPKK